MLVAIDFRFTELFQFKSRLNGFAVQQGAGDGRESIAGCRRIVGDPFGNIAALNKNYTNLL